MAAHFVTPTLLNRTNTLFVGTGARRKGRPVYFRGNAIKKKVLFGSFNGFLARTDGAEGEIAFLLYPLVETASANMNTEIARARLAKNISVSYACPLDADSTLSGFTNTIFMAVMLLREYQAPSFVEITSSATGYAGATLNLTPPAAPGDQPGTSFLYNEQDIVVWDLASLGVNETNVHKVTSPMEVQLMRGDMLAIGFAILCGDAVDITRADAAIGTGGVDSAPTTPDIYWCFECEEIM